MDPNSLCAVVCNCVFVISSITSLAHAGSYRGLPTCLSTEGFHANVTSVVSSLVTGRFASSANLSLSIFNGDHPHR